MGVCTESGRKRKNDPDTKSYNINTINNDKTSILQNKHLSSHSSVNITTKPSVTQKALISK